MFRASGAVRCRLVAPAVVGAVRLALPLPVVDAAVAGAGSGPAPATALVRSIVFARSRFAPGSVPAVPADAGRGKSRASAKSRSRRRQLSSVH